MRIEAWFQRRNLAWAITAVILISLTAIVLQKSYEARDNLWRLGEQSAEHVTRLAAQMIGRDIEIYDLSLRAVAEGVLDPEVMNQAPGLRAKTLFDNSAKAKGFGFIDVADENGRVIVSSKAMAPETLDLARQDFFLIHKTSATDVGLYISRPFRSPLADDRWTIALSRKILDASGAFKGIVSGYIAVDYLNDILQRALLGSDGVVAVLRDDGFLIARSVFDDRVAARSWQSAQLMSALRAAPDGRFVKRSLDDGIDRLYVYRRIAGTSLAITSGIAVDHILGSWRSRTILYALIIGLLAIAVILLVLLLDRELIKRSDAERSAQQLARTDALTGVANRRMFDEYLERELARAQRQRINVSLLMVDVDWFKIYNDHYGHQEGDRALARIATALQVSTRSHFDLVARYGGEEFAIVFLHENFEDGSKFAARAVETVRDLAIPASGSPLGFVSVSCGIATCMDGHTGAAALVAMADAALYQAKAAGRDRFCRAERSRLQQAA